VSHDVVLCDTHFNAIPMPMTAPCKNRAKRITHALGPYLYYLGIEGHVITWKDK
jgi:hypothetical protein